MNTKLVKVEILRSIKVNGKYLQPSNDIAKPTLVELEEDLVKGLFAHPNTKDVVRILGDLVIEPVVENTANVLTDEELAEAIEELENIEEIEEQFRLPIIELGFTTVESIAVLTASDLTVVKGIGEATANKIIDGAKLFED